MSLMIEKNLKELASITFAPPINFDETGRVIPVSCTVEIEVIPDSSDPNGFTMNSSARIRHAAPAR